MLHSESGTLIEMPRNPPSFSRKLKELVMKSYDNSKLNGYAHMLAVLRSLEKEMGLSELTKLDRSILAVLSLEEFAQGARTESLMNHNILESPTQSSFYRALKRLRENELIGTVGDRKTGVYRLTN